jgi:RNA polymerase sigma factor (sigma-70 family)
MEANGARKELRYGDEHLARAVSAGDDEAFEILFQRHQPAILAFCRHMLGRPHDAQDAAQHTFLTAYRVLRAGNAPEALRSWLFAVARNRCISMLRVRREQAGDDGLAEVSTEGLAGQVQDRADLRALLSDVAELPDDQRAALLLAEIGDVSHKEIAGVIGVRREKVKALVFQARRALMAARDARDTPCLTIQQELATARGAALRRAHLRRHLHVCPSCREFREELRLQRDALALLLPVAPAMLRDSILGASGAAAGGSAAAAGAPTGAAAAAGAPTGAAGGSAAATGANAAAAGSKAVATGVTAVLKATAVKVGVGVVAAGGIAAGGTVAELPRADGADSGAARNAPVTIAGSPRTASPTQWTPTSGKRPLAAGSAGEPAGGEALVRPSKPGGTRAGEGTGRHYRAERGPAGQPDHARADADGRGPGQAAAERGPKTAKPKHAGAKSNQAGGRGPARGPGTKAKPTGGPKPKHAGGPGSKPKSTGRGTKPTHAGGLKPKPARAKPKPANGRDPKPTQAGSRGGKPNTAGAKQKPADPKPSPAGGPGARSKPAGPKPGPAGGRSAKPAPAAGGPTPHSRAEAGSPQNGQSGGEPSRKAITPSQSNATAPAQQAPPGSAGSSGSGGTLGGAPSNQGSAATAQRRGR